MKRNPPRVLIDVDGVLADFFGSAQRVILELSEQLIRFEDLKSWDIFESLPKEIEEESYKRFSDPGFCANLAVLPGSQEAFEKLSKAADVYVVTSPMHTPTWAYERAQWLERNFGVPSARIVQTSAKYLCKGDVLIDDRARNIHEWASHHPDGIGVMWAAPHNAHEPIPDNVVRLSTWDDVVDLVTKLGE